MWIQYLNINCPLNASTSCKSLYSPFNSITQILNMRCGNKMPLSFHSKIFFVHKQIWKVLIVFILGWGTITKITYAFKACVPYFLIKFLFFHQMIAIQKLRKKFFISSKKLFFILEIFKFL